MSEALQSQLAVPAAHGQYASMLTAFESFPQMMQVSEALAHSSIVPQRFQNDPGSVLIALDMAARSNLNPLMVMQNLYTVYGTPSFSGKFALTLLRRSGLFSRLGFEYRENGNWEAGVRLVAVSLDGETTEFGPWIDKPLVLAMGWLSKNDSMWKKMPDQMARYRAASWFCNTNCPEVLMGLPTMEELEESPEVLRNVSPAEGKVSRARGGMQPGSPALKVSKPAQPLLPMVVPDAVAADAESIAAADGLPEAAADAPATTSPQAPQAVEYRGSAPDACSDIQERLKAMGARWRQFARWCEAHGVQLPETGSGREAYNEVCAAVLADAELMEAFHRELKLN